MIKFSEMYIAILTEAKNYQAKGLTLSRRDMLQILAARGVSARPHIVDILDQLQADGLIKA